MDFPISESVDATALLVPMGHFLSQINRLAAWSAEEILWDSRLAQQVTDALRDGGFVEQLLDNDYASKAPTSSGDVDELLASAAWKSPLTKFQRENVSRLLEIRHGANFSVPGAGKTRTSLAVYEILKSQGIVEQLVVVAPKSAHGSWLDEIETCLTEPPSVEVVNAAHTESAEVTIVNYERLQSNEFDLAQRISARPTLLLLDEAHRMKRGADGAHGTICLSLGPLAARRMVLSGTPAPNGAKDLQALMEFLWPGHGSGLVDRQSQGGSAITPLFVRTTKDHLDLPPMRPTIRHLPLPPLHRKIYDALVGQLAQRVDESESVDDLGRIVVYLLMAATSPALLAVGATRTEALQFRVPPLALPVGDRIRSLMAELPEREVSPKILEAVRIARDNASNNRKTLIWSTFHRNVNTLQNLLAGSGAVSVTGATDRKDRDDNIHRFKTDDNCKVLISNPATLGEGISLHKACHDAVYLDRDFAAGRFLQSLDRIHRLGLEPDQETRVTILASENTIDDLVSARLDEKIRFMDEILDDPSLRELTDLEEAQELDPVIDYSDQEALYKYLLGHKTA
ncbi:DEAD/DEAH box helicase [Frigoribacterium sp. RIT-PI-h]|uniref:DEAD/DEAH box helicase n=1 Tax=Frigoribacterium sp. RIT-PI-h TaxID=1690245 RepID=UPI00128ECCAE|nr:DEAD/DEAH box helicase [Frigoribacterium sp. RIT-PI-h]